MNAVPTVGHTDRFSSIKKEDLEVTITGDRLTLEAKREFEEKEEKEEEEEDIDGRVWLSLGGPGCGFVRAPRSAAAAACERRASELELAATRDRLAQRPGKGSYMRT